MSRDDANWATSGVLGAPTAPAEAIDLGLAGRRVTSPLQGFGQMWQKRYLLTLPDPAPAPAEVIATWKAEFPSLWPKGNLFYAPLAGIKPGEVALLNLTLPGGTLLSTGVLVLYADDESFTLMTPPGHMFAGWITFSARTEDAATVVEANVLMRASDPIFELGMALGGHRKEDETWLATLRSLAARFGYSDPQVSSTTVCVDRRRQWRHAANVRQNSALRSGWYAVRHARARRRPVP